MVEYVSDCNGCVECHFCGRRSRKRAIYKCDWCRKECSLEGSQEIDGDLVCGACYGAYMDALDDVYDDMEE